MNKTFRFFTDAATLAIFDPERLASRATADGNWWCGNMDDLPEVKTGAIVLVALGGDGVYQIRITDEELTADERDYAAELIDGLGVEVVSRQLYFGPGECLPGGGVAFEAAAAERGLMLPLENGAYRIDAYAISWVESPRWWSEDHQPPADAPADFVLQIRPRSPAFVARQAPARFHGCSDEFLYESATRLIGPQPGMLVTAKVRKDLTGLALHYSGPGSYRAKLLDYSQVAWKDTIRLRVVSVDHEEQTLVGEFVEKVS